MNTNEKMTRTYNLKKLAMAGITTMWLDTPRYKEFKEKRKARIPFSQLYKTYSDYRSDVNLAISFT